MKFDKKELIKDDGFLQILGLFEWAMVAAIAVLGIGATFNIDIEPMTMQQLTYLGLMLAAIVILNLIRDIRIGLVKQKEKENEKTDNAETPLKG